MVFCGVRWSLISFLLGLIGVRLWDWLGGVLLKLGNSLLAKLLSLIGESSSGKFAGCPSNNTLAGFSSSFWFSGRGLLNISSKVILVMFSSSSSRFSMIKKELLWLVGVWILEIPVVIWLSGSLSISGSVVADSVNGWDPKYIVLRDGALENSAPNNCCSGFGNYLGMWNLYLPLSVKGF